MPVVISKRLPYPCEVNECRHHHENVKDVVRASPDIERPRSSRFWKASRIEDRAENEYRTFEQVVRHARLLPGPVKSVYDSTVDDGCKSRASGQDENKNAEGTPVSTLKPGVQNEDGAQDTKNGYLG